MASIGRCPFALQDLLSNSSRRQYEVVLTLAMKKGDRKNNIHTAKTTPTHDLGYGSLAQKAVRFFPVIFIETLGSFFGKCLRPKKKTVE